MGAACAVVLLATTLSSGGRAGLLPAGQAASAAAAAAPPGYGSPVWRDEFSRLSLDVNGTGTGNWVPRMRAWGTPVVAAHNDKCLKESSGYAPPGGRPLNLSLHRVRNGVITLYGRQIPAAQRAAFFGPNPDPGYEAMCGTLDGSLSHAQTYGYWEVRLRQVNVSLGHHIAVWLAPSNGAWPPEFDLFETIGANPAVPYSSADKFHFVSHFLDGNGTPQSDLGYTNVGQANATTWHTVGLEWTAQTVTWFLDGQVMLQTDAAKYGTTPMSLMVTSETSSDWPGATTSATTWPLEYQLDYVRIYQKPAGA
jgi:serralysin